MMDLDDKNRWQSLSSCGEADKLPGLIQQLLANPSIVLLDEICWEHIYHQNTLYQTTITTIPHLLDLATNNTTNLDFCLHLFLNVGIILAELDVKGEYLKAIIDEGELSPGFRQEIKTAFDVALLDFKWLGELLLPLIRNKDETTKRHFLAAWAVVEAKFTIGKLFVTYSDNNDYMAVCTYCEREHYLWNEEGKLNVYKSDPVFNKEQPSYSINLAYTTNDRQLLADVQWLYKMSNLLGIASLQSLLPYFRGSFECVECAGEHEVFKAILNAI